MLRFGDVQIGIVKDMPQAYNVQWKFCVAWLYCRELEHSIHSKQLKCEWFTTLCNQNFHLSPTYNSQKNIYQRSIGDLLTHIRWKTSIVICIWNKITYFCQLPSSLVSLNIKSHHRPTIATFSCSSPPWHHRTSKFPISTRKQTQIRVSLVFLPLLALKIIYEWLSLDISLFTLPTDNQYLRQIESEFYSS